MNPMKTTNSEPTWLKKGPLMRAAVTAPIVTLLLAGLWGAPPENAQAQEIIQRAVEAMGGAAFRGIRTRSTSGRYFAFRKGRKAFIRFQSWTQYENPAKFRQQLGKGKRQTVVVYNLELDRGWRQEGLHEVDLISQQQIEDFRHSVKTDIDYLLLNRLDEEGMSFFYFGPDEVAGAGNWEAVEFIDSSNDSVIIYFDVDSHLPAKIESHFTDSMGLRHESSTEFYNWHTFNAVRTPLRLDTYVDGELAQQYFLEETQFNPLIPAEMFLKPVVKPKKDKKKKKKRSN